MLCVSEPLIAHKKPELHILLYTLRQYAAGYNSSVAAMQMKVCCSSPASICYWFIVSLAAWAVLAAIGGFWQPLHAFIGGNLFARYGGRLLCQCAQEPDVSLHAHRAAISDSRDSATFVEPNARQA